MDASLDEWQAVMELALRYVTDCGTAYKKGDDRARHLYNGAFFEQMLVRDGKICKAEFRAPFDQIFPLTEFYYGNPVEAAGIEPACEAAFNATSTSVVPVWISPRRYPGTRSIATSLSRCPGWR